MSIIFPFDKAVVEKAPELYKYLENRSVEKFIAYLLHSDYRDAVSLEPWIAAQVKNPTPAVQAFADAIPLGVDDDETALNCLYHVIHAIKYVGDTQRWKMPEYWATADETLTATTMTDGITYLPQEGDCEDGAILLYVTCRLKGIKPEKLMLFAGDVYVNDGTGTSSEGFIKAEDINSVCQPDSKDFRKEIENGIILTAKQTESGTVNASLLLQSLKLALNLPTKDIEQLRAEDEQCGFSSRIDSRFVNDAETIGEQNSLFTIGTKIDSITALAILRFYVSPATADITAQKQTRGNSKKDKSPGINNKTTSGSGGHCWLGYRPVCYPLNWVFLDWCYWPTEFNIGIRNFYYIKDNDIFGENPNGITDERYQKIWFGFNEEHSILKMNYAW